MYMHFSSAIILDFSIISGGGNLTSRDINLSCMITTVQYYILLSEREGGGEFEVRVHNERQPKVCGTLSRMLLYPCVSKIE